MIRPRLTGCFPHRVQGQGQAPGVLAAGGVQPPPLPPPAPLPESPAPGAAPPAQDPELQAFQRDPTRQQNAEELMAKYSAARRGRIERQQAPRVIPAPPATTRAAVPPRPVPQAPDQPEEPEPAPPSIVAARLHIRDVPGLAMLYGTLLDEWTELDLRTNRHNSAVLCPLIGVAIPKTCFKSDVLFYFTASSRDLAQADAWWTNKFSKWASWKQRLADFAGSQPQDYFHRFEVDNSRQTQGKVYLIPEGADEVVTSEQVPHLHADAQVAIVMDAGIELEVRALIALARSQRG